MIKKNREQNIISRRKFLKKAVYTTPSLLVLGQLLDPTLIDAETLPSSPMNGNMSGKMQSSQANKRTK